MTRFNLSAFAVRERAITLFMIIVIMVAGGDAFLRLGRAEDPKFTVKTMTVTARWPGATAKEMQEQVGDRLEKRLQELEFYDRVETSAYPGMLLMKLQLKDSTPPKDVPDEFYQTRKKLGDEKINLPKGVIGPILNDEFSDVYFAMYALKAKGLLTRSVICENNFYGIGTEVHRSSALPDIHKRTCGYDVPSERVDGMDVIAVYQAVRHAAEWVREQSRPYLIEAVTYRFRGHSMADPAKYRSAAEHEMWKARDPIPGFARRLVGEGITPESQLETIREKCVATVQEAVQFAENSSWPEDQELWEDIYV